MKSGEKPLYPECEKLESISKVSNSIGEFLDWSFSRGYLKHGREFKTIEKTLADFFNIDMNKVEQERRQILDSLRMEKK